MLLGPAAQAFTLAVSAAVAQVGDGVSALNHRVPVEAVGEAHARPKVQIVNGYLVVAGAAHAVAVLRGSAEQVAGRRDLAVLGARNTLIVLGHGVGHHQVVAQAGVQRQLVRELEVVLDVQPETAFVLTAVVVDDVRLAESGRPSRKLANELPYWEKLELVVFGIEVSAWLKLKWPPL